jgi:superfamily II DNA or RNA helicase
MTTRIPEEGQLVRVRSRQWIVSRVEESGGEGDGQGTGRMEHLVTVESIEEDGLGEELKVVWELEPGAEVLSEVTFPAMDGFDRAEDLQAFLDAVRWGASAAARTQALQSPFRSGIQIEDFQLDPLVRAVDMARSNLLIADDVGLGKTVEAGLVVQELILRHRARTVLVVCPASLLEKWRGEMQEKFGLEFRVLNRDYLRELRRTRGIRCNPWTSYPRLIVSMDWAKQGEGWRWLKDALPVRTQYPRPFDILIVDEAHNVAPSGRGAYALDSLRTKLVRRLSPHFTHHLFLTATPHNGYKESFTALLELLDNQRFARNVEPDEKQLSQVLIRRLKGDLKDGDGRRMFAERKVLRLEVEYTEEERKAHQALREFTQLRLAGASGGDETTRAVKFLLVLLKKRLFSSPAAFATTLEQVIPQLEGSASRGGGVRLTGRGLKAVLDRAEREEYGSDEEAEEAEADAASAAADASRAAGVLATREAELLQQLRDWARQAAVREDSKFRAIIGWAKANLKQGGRWGARRVLIFTQYMDTLKALQQQLAQNGLGGDRLLVLTGSTPPDERLEICNQFQSPPDGLTDDREGTKVRILLATDSASEGIDLQRYCHDLIHVEIPWSPTVLEQRNGRVDRHGQKSAEVNIWCPAGTRALTSAAGSGQELDEDGEYLWRMAEKVNSIRDYLSVGTLLTEATEEYMLERRTQGSGATAEAERRLAQTRKLAEDRRRDERIRAARERVLESKQEMAITPGRVLGAVQTALRLAGQPLLTPSAAPPAGVPPEAAWDVPRLTGSWSAARTGLEDPVTHRQRPLCFDAEVAQANNETLVHAHLKHRLVDMSLRLLREELWKTGGGHLHRVSVRRDRTGLAHGEPVVLAWARLLVIGGDNTRLHEEVTLAGGVMRGDGSFRRIDRQGDLARLAKESVPADPEGFRSELLLQRFHEGRIREGLEAAVEARGADRMKTLKNTIRQTAEREEEAVRTLLDELERAIRSELVANASGPMQMEFHFTEFEQQQHAADRQALEARLEALPEERESELELLRRHFATPKAFFFPVAVEFVVPDLRVWGGGEERR